VEADFAVSALTGLLAGLLGAIMPGVLFWLLWGMFWLPFVCFASVFCLVGLFWRQLVTDRSLWATESIVSDRVEPDGGLQMPALPAPGNVVLLNPYNGRERLESERGKREQSGFADFVTGCQFDTSARRWSGEPNYTRWRESLIASGWGHWRKDGEPRAGWELTAPAERVIEAMDL